MPLTPGTRLGPYEIVAPLGAGGMGEVHRARDTRLGREVAIKVLPQALTANPEVRARFEREARTVSSLNHPHICTLHDIGREGDTDFLVMELVEGGTLAQRLANGPLPTAEVLRLGAQIAEALDRAHRAGVVHRDLKPGNVMLTKSGAKLMDFGLARATGLAGPEGGSGVTVRAVTHSPTMAQPLTAEGTILGTFQYMSPEQLEGKEADSRSDLWALGCVLFEMATGRRAFEGPSQASLISSIMKDDPRPVSELAPLAPAALDRVVRECLAKDPDERVQSAHDLKLHLDWIREGSQSGAPAVAAPRSRGRHRLLWTAAASLAVLGAAGGFLLRGAGVAPAAVHASVTPPPGCEFSSSTSTPIPLAVSPDGANLVFCAHRGEGPDLLWVRPLGSREARALAGTEDAYSPFFSFDGRSIGFFAEGKLKRVDLAGGPVTTLATVSDPRGGSWNRDGVILFAPGSEGGLFQVPADGGPTIAVTTLDSTVKESTHRYPVFLPDGRHYLFLVRRSGSGSGEDPKIFAGTLGTTKRQPVVNVASNVAYAQGHLLYSRGAILMAQPFDAGRLATTGPAVSMFEDLRWDERFSRGVFAASSNGVLAFMTGRGPSQSQLLWVDRTGRPLGRVGEPADYTYGGSPRVSPDGTRAAMAIQNADRGTSDIWVVDLTSGRRRRLTVDDEDHPGCSWSHDGSKVVVNTGGDGSRLVPLVARSVVGSATDTLTRRRGYMWPSSASPDGRLLLFVDDDGAGGGDVLAVPMSGEGPAVPVAAGRGREGMPQYSRDGRFVAYVSNESGRDEVYVVTFPVGGGKWQVSQGGGREPRWSRDGRELFYMDRQNQLISVSVDGTGTEFEAGTARSLFAIHGTGADWRYDVSPDGTRFLVMAPPEGVSAPPVELMTNWTARLPKR